MTASIAQKLVALQAATKTACTSPPTAHGISASLLPLTTALLQEMTAAQMNVSQESPYYRLLYTMDATLYYVANTFPSS